MNTSVLPMGGWVTWVGVIGSLALAVVDFKKGDYQSMGEKIAFAVSAIGIGRKIEKDKKKPNPEIDMPT